MEKFVIEATDTNRGRLYVDGIRISSGRIYLHYTSDIEKAALFTEEAAARFVMEAANVGLASYWASPVKLELRMVVP